LRIANSKPQPPDLASRGSRSGINDCPGPLQAIGGGTGRSRRGLREATYNGGGTGRSRRGLGEATYIGGGTGWSRRGLGEATYNGGRRTDGVDGAPLSIGVH